MTIRRLPPLEFSKSEAVTPVEGLTKLSFKVAAQHCRASAAAAENAITELVNKLSTHPPPMFDP